MVDVVRWLGAAEEDSQRIAGSVRTRGSNCEGRVVCDVRGVWMSRFVDVGMYSAGAALNVYGAETREKERNKENVGRIAIVYSLPKIEVAVRSVARAGRR